MAKELKDHERAHSGKPGADVEHGNDPHGINKFNKNFYTADDAPQEDSEFSHNATREYKHHAVVDIKNHYKARGINMGYRKVTAEAKRLGLKVGTTLTRNALKNGPYTQDD